MPSLPACTSRPTLSAVLSAPVSQVPSGPNSCLVNLPNTWVTPPWQWKSTRTHIPPQHSTLSVLKSERASWPHTHMFKTSFAVSDPHIHLGPFFSEANFFLTFWDFLPVLSFYSHRYLLVYPVDRILHLFARPGPRNRAVFAQR